MWWESRKGTRIMSKYQITFDEKTHVYTINGEKAVSVTTFLKAIGISADVSGIPPAVLEAARQRGNYYDQLAEEAINDPFELNDWQERLLEVLKKNGLEITSAQTIYGTMDPINLCGTGDFGGHYLIADLKATNEIYMNSVTWQTNIYAWLKDPENYEQYKKYVIHYNEKDDRFTVLELKNIPIANIKRAIECFQLGETYEEGLTETNQIVDIQAFSKVFDEVKMFEDQLKEAKAKLDAFYEEIKANMIKANIKSFEIENFKITYTPPTERKTVDYSQASEDKNMKVLEYTNNLLTKLGKDPIHIYTSNEMEEILTDEEKELYTKVVNVKDRLTVTPKKKK